jgi:CRISPR system Cascade subunit CasA
MNLLFDPWIPVQKDNTHRHIALKELLCHEEDWTVSLPRDDLEMACLQLLIALTQALFTPEDFDEWLGRQDTPLTEEEYDHQARRYMNWFDLDHVTQPFMQRRDMKAEKVTPIQKLFIGMPEGNNHAFFNQVSEITVACSSCTVLALFNQTTNAPNFSGKHKAGLRGAAPISTLIHANSLRRMVWRNVLSEAVLNDSMPWWKSGNQAPAWIENIASGEKMHVTSIGLMRGLFWLPLKIELVKSNGEAVCGCCGLKIQAGYSGFNLEEFKFEMQGKWPHPLSPRQWEVKKGERQEGFLSFTSTAPAWTQLTQFVIEKQGEREGHSPAPVVTQFGSMQSYGEPLYLLVGGYRNKQAAVLERRHELFNLAQGWAEHGDDVVKIVSLGLQVKDALRGTLYGFSKTTGIARQEEAQAQFYRRSERLIHDLLCEMDFNQFNAARDRLAQDLSKLALDIFEEQTAPYQHRPEIYKSIALARAGLRAKLNKLKGNNNA